jgi:hypothetical protein
LTNPFRIPSSDAKNALANRRFNLVQVNSSQRAKRHPAASVMFAAIGVLIDLLAYLS